MKTWKKVALATVGAIALLAGDTQSKPSFKILSRGEVTSR